MSLGSDDQRRLLRKELRGPANHMGGKPAVSGVDLCDEHRDDGVGTGAHGGGDHDHPLQRPAQITPSIVPNPVIPVLVTGIHTRASQLSAIAAHCLGWISVTNTEMTE